MLLAFFDFDPKNLLWISIVAIALGVIVVLISVITVLRKNGKNGKIAKNADNTSVDGNAETNISDEGNLPKNNVLVMSRNVMYSAGQNGQVVVGKYRMDSADDTNDKFNVRVNGLVKEYQNGAVVILADGDTISPVSGSVTLTFCED